MKVLVIDDEIDILMMVSRSLEKYSDFSVICSESPLNAMEMALNENPDVIVLDYFMEEMDGDKFIVKIKENEKLKNIPVIFLTAKDEPEIIKMFMEAGAKGVIKKPFNPKNLNAQIHQILGF